MKNNDNEITFEKKCFINNTTPIKQVEICNNKYIIINNNNSIVIYEYKKYNIYNIVKI